MFHKSYPRSFNYSSRTAWTVSSELLGFCYYFFLIFSFLCRTESYLVMWTAGLSAVMSVTCCLCSHCFSMSSLGKIHHRVRCSAQEKHREWIKCKTIIDVEGVGNSTRNTPPVHGPSFWTPVFTGREHGPGIRAVCSDSETEDSSDTTWWKAEVFRSVPKGCTGREHIT